MNLGINHQQIVVYSASKKAHFLTPVFLAVFYVCVGFGLFVMDIHELHAAEKTNDEVFNEAKTWGKAQSTAPKGYIQNNEIKNTVPGYPTSNPWQGELYQGGFGNTKASGAMVASDCKTNPLKSESKDTEQCNALNLLQHAAGTNNPYTITENDPMIINTRPIINNPSSGSGGLPFNGQYGDCKDKPINIPEKREEFKCEIYSKIDESSCVVGTQLVFDKNTRYQCDQTVKTIKRQSCQKTLTIEMKPCAAEFPVEKSPSFCQSCINIPAPTGCSFDLRPPINQIPSICVEYVNDWAPSVVQWPVTGTVVAPKATTWNGSFVIGQGTWPNNNQAINQFPVQSIRDRVDVSKLAVIVSTLEINLETSATGTLALKQFDYKAIVNSIPVLSVYVNNKLVYGEQFTLKHAKAANIARIIHCGETPNCRASASMPYLLAWRTTDALVLINQSLGSFVGGVDNPKIGSYVAQETESNFGMGGYRESPFLKSGTKQLNAYIPISGGKNTITFVTIDRVKWGESIPKLSFQITANCARDVWTGCATLEGASQ